MIGRICDPVLMPVCTSKESSTWAKQVVAFPGQEDVSRGKLQIAEYVRCKLGLKELKQDLKDVVKVESRVSTMEVSLTKLKQDLKDVVKVCYWLKVAIAILTLAAPILGMTVALWTLFPAMGVGVILYGRSLYKAYIQENLKKQISSLSKEKGLLDFKHQSLLDKEDEEIFRQSLVSASKSSQQLYERVKVAVNKEPCKNRDSEFNQGVQALNQILSKEESNSHKYKVAAFLLEVVNVIMNGGGSVLAIALLQPWIALPFTAIGYAGYFIAWHFRDLSEANNQSSLFDYKVSLGKLDSDYKTYKKEVMSYADWLIVKNRSALHSGHSTIKTPGAWTTETPVRIGEPVKALGYLNIDYHMPQYSRTHNENNYTKPLSGHLL